MPFIPICQPDSVNTDDLQVIDKYKYNTIRDNFPYKNVILFSFKVPDDTTMAVFKFELQVATRTIFCKINILKIFK